MKLANPLKSLSWNALFRSSQTRFRRRRSTELTTAAEVLEIRSLLAANVAANVAAGVLTLTAGDASDHSVNVYRLDAGHVEIDGVAGTTINGAASQVLNLSAVNGIRVNLGAGYDTYHIFSAAGNPALNIGAGGILFQGLGGTGDDLQVFNSSSSDMTIGGSILVQGTPPKTSLIQTGSGYSDFQLYASSAANLTINGSVSVLERVAGNETLENKFYTQGTGNLNIKGSVVAAVTVAAASSASVHNLLASVDLGNVSVGGGIVETITGGSGQSINAVTTGFPLADAVALGGLLNSGNVSVGPGGVTQATSGQGTGYNAVLTNASGNIAIAGSVSQSSVESFASANLISTGVPWFFPMTQAPANAAVPLATNLFPVGGTLSISGAAVQTAVTTPPVNSKTDGMAWNLTESGVSDLTIGGSLTQSVVNSAPGFLFAALNIASAFGSGNFRVGGGLTQSAVSTNNVGGTFFGALNLAGAGTLPFLPIFESTSASAPSQFTLINSGAFSVAGNVTQTATASGSLGTDFGGANFFYEGSAGDVTVGGSVLQTLTSQGGGANVVGSMFINSSNSVSLLPVDFADMTIGVGVSQTAVGAGSFENGVINYGGSNLKIGAGGITIKETNTSSRGENNNFVGTWFEGSLTTTGVISITTNNTDGSSPQTTYNEIGTQTLPGAAVAQDLVLGSLSAAGVVIVTAGNQAVINEINADGSPIAIGAAGVTIASSGAGYHSTRISTGYAYSPITIAGSVTVSDTGSGFSEFGIETDSDNSPISIAKNVIYDNSANKTTASSVDIHGSTDDINSQVTIGGNLSINLAKSVNIAPPPIAPAINLKKIGNEVSLGENEGNEGLGYGLIVNGNLTIIGSNGRDLVYIQEAQFKGVTNINLLTNPKPVVTSGVQLVGIDGIGPHDLLIIDGSAFGGTVYVTMSGPNAEIAINDYYSAQTTTFSALFQAVMAGTNPIIYVATQSTDSGVAFNGTQITTGTFGSGGVIQYHAANVTGNIIAINFTKVLV